MIGSGQRIFIIVASSSKKPDALNKMNKILVTGATGLLGASLVPYLKKIGYMVVTQARTTKADLTCDLTNKIATHAFLEKLKPNIIINLAALTNVDVCEEEINLAYLANTCVVECLTQWILQAKSDCHLIQISTDHLYGGEGPHSEDKISIVNNYAFSKYAGELAADRVPSTILRTNFVGCSSVSYRESLTDWLYKSIIDSKQIQVFSDIYFSPLTIKNLVQMIEVVIQNKPIGIYNLGSHNGMSKADFAFAFAECLKLPTNSLVRVTSNQSNFFKVRRPLDMRMDCSKLENALRVVLPKLPDLIQSIADEYHEKS